LSVIIGFNKSNIDQQFQLRTMQNHVTEVKNLILSQDTSLSAINKTLKINGNDLQSFIAQFNGENIVLDHLLNLR